MPQFDQALAEAFYFEEPDVIANRTGRLSARQETMFRDGAVLYRKQVPKIMWLLAVALVAVIVMVLSQAKGDTGQIALALGATVAAMGVIVLLVRKNYSQADRFEAGAAVQVARGPVAVDQNPYNWLTDGDHVVGWEVSIGEVKFRFLPEQAEAFTPGAAYAIYYADFGQPRLSFLSAERA